MTNFLLACVAFGLYVVAKRLLAIQRAIESRPAPVAISCPAWTLGPTLPSPEWELTPWGSPDPVTPTFPHQTTCGSFCKD